MFIITRNQIQALEKVQQENFEARAAARLRQFFEACRSMKEDELQKLIRFGIAQAKEQGFTSARDASRYLGLIMALGVNFEQGERTPWARTILDDESATPSMKLDRLYERALREGK